MIDEEYARRYRETWDLAFTRGSSMPEELDRARMLNTRQRRRELLESASRDLSEAALPRLADKIKVPLEAATFADGVRAAIAWIDSLAKDQ